MGRKREGSFLGLPAVTLQVVNFPEKLCCPEDYVFISQLPNPLPAALLFLMKEKAMAFEGWLFLAGGVECIWTPIVSAPLEGRLGRRGVVLPCCMPCICRAL